MIVLMVSIESLRKKVLEQTKKRLAEAYTEKDRYVIQAIEALDDVDATFNLLIERIREWYGLHFPELNTLVKDHEAYLDLILTLGKRDQYNKEAVEAILKRNADVVVNAARESSGTDIGDRDLEMIQGLARIAKELKDYRKELNNYIEDVMEEVAPNVKYLAGPLLGARLIAKAGGLKKLSLMPASTIQVLGAEKALFRHLTKGSRPPKHGILFQHPWVRSAKPWQRGKIARSLAAKIAIAAREYYFGGKFVGEELKAELEERVKEVKEKYREPPRKEERKGRKEKGRRRKR